MIKSAVHKLHQVCSSQIASSRQFTNCIKPAVHKLHQACMQFTTCIKSAVHNLQQVCMQFTTCITSAVHNLHQVCGRQLAASLWTTCNILDIIKLEILSTDLIISSLMIASCIKSAADLLQIARFWLCNCISLTWKMFYIC